MVKLFKPKYTKKEKDILKKAKEKMLNYEDLTYEEICKLNEMLDKEIKFRTKNIRKIRRENHFLRIIIHVQETMIHILEKIIKGRNKKARAKK